MTEVLTPLVQEDARRAKALAEGAVLRLWCGEQCVKAYRQHFGLPQRTRGTDAFAVSEEIREFKACAF